MMRKSAERHLKIKQEEDAKKDTILTHEQSLELSSLL